MDDINIDAGNAPGQYHSVNMSAFPAEDEAGGTSQLRPTIHQPPAETTPEDLNFVSLSVENGSSPVRVEGAISAGKSLGGGEMGSMKSQPHKRTRPGMFLESKGFGWLMEVEEEDSEEENRPLLLVSSTIRLNS